MGCPLSDPVSGGRATSASAICPYSVFFPVMATTAVAWPLITAVPGKRQLLCSGLSLHPLPCLDAEGAIEVVVVFRSVSTAGSGSAVFSIGNGSPVRADWLTKKSRASTDTMAQAAGQRVV